jgi:hypothetical protein
VTMRARVAVLAAVAAAAAAVPPLAAAGTRRVVSDCDHSQVRPDTVWISCNNPSVSFTRLRWTSFGGPLARATGVMRAENCPRACLPGKVHEYPVSLVFSQARPCPDGYDDYRLLSVAYSSPTRPPGSAAQPPPQALFCPLTN